VHAFSAAAPERVGVAGTRGRELYSLPKAPGRIGDGSVTYVKALPRHRLALGQPLAVSLHGERILLADLGDRIVAVEAACLRCSDVLDLSTGDPDAAACRGCGWRYDLRTGRVAGVPALRIRGYPVREADGTVYVDCAPAAGDPSVYARPRKSR
jgi:nitrite reductase/ring-hydroxylating ferredoxin subunit